MKTITGLEILLSIFLREQNKTSVWKKIYIFVPDCEEGGAFNINILLS